MAGKKLELQLCTNMEVEFTPLFGIRKMCTSMKTLEREGKTNVKTYTRAPCLGWFMDIPEPLRGYCWTPHGPGPWHWYQ